MHFSALGQPLTPIFASPQTDRMPALIYIIIPIPIHHGAIFNHLRSCLTLSVTIRWNGGSPSLCRLRHPPPASATTKLHGGPRRSVGLFLAIACPPRDRRRQRASIFPHITFSGVTGAGMDPRPAPEIPRPRPDGRHVLGNSAAPVPEATGDTDVVEARPQITAASGGVVGGCRNRILQASRSPYLCCIYHGFRRCCHKACSQAR